MGCHIFAKTVLSKASCCDEGKPLFCARTRFPPLSGLASTGLATGESPCMAFMTFWNSFGLFSKLARKLLNAGSCWLLLLMAGSLK